MWNLSRPDWQDRIRAGRSILPDLQLNEADVRRAIGIFNKLRIPDVTGSPSFGEAAGDWFREIVGALFGSMVDGERMVRELLLLVPKKNSKTTNGAGLMMTALVDNRRPRAEFLLIGPTKDVADLAFSQATGMIEADPEGFLQKRMHIQEHIKTITDRRTKAKLKIKTFDSSVLTGVKPVGVLVDELHEIAKSPSATNVIRQIRGGLLPNPEGFLVFITTQSDGRPQGAFRAELMKARQIRDGRAAGSMLPVLYEFPDDIAADPARWQDPSNWPMVTPNAGRSIRIERLLQEFEAAKLGDPGEVAGWASQHLNIEIGLGLKTDRWPGAEFWARRADPSITLESLLERCEVVCVGIDGGGLDDLFGLNVLGREKATRHWLSWTHAWCHEGVLERRKAIAAQLRDFEAAGELTIVDDELKDVAEIVAIVEQVKDAGLLACVGVDPAGLGEFIEALAEIGVTQENKLVVGVPQGYGMMNAIKTAERKLANGTLRHSGSGLMAWAVSNLKIEPTATAIRATKQNAGDAKIDPAMALFDAVVPMSLNPEPARAPEYQLIFV
ncbi:terminase large subunit [Methylobacterium oxalidis]|uniref:terminase large subunit n=1 Tax=Methylobacterium oxalidis TaxID=944322 RepID=UPI0033145342